MDTTELQKRLDELTEYLGEISLSKYDAEERKAVIEAIEKLGRLINETDRLNNEELRYKSQNSSDQTKSKREMVVGLIRPILEVLASLGLGLISFKGEWIKGVLRDRTFWDLAKSLRPR